MPKQEMEDFFRFWKESMILNEREARNPGGVSKTEGVDYEKYLIPWCKGNSVSVDQNTLREPRVLVTLLIRKFRDAIQKQDQNYSNWKRIDRRFGVNYNDLQEALGRKSPQAQRRGKKYGAGDIIDEWRRAEQILQILLLNGHISLFRSGNSPEDKENGFRHPTELDRNEGKIKKLIESDYNDPDIQLTQGNSPGDVSKMYIVNHLVKYVDRGAFICISRRNGWDTYIRDRYGCPSGFEIENILPGSLCDEGQEKQPKTIGIDLHLIFAESIARSYSKRGEWGRNQSLILREICDLALEGDGSSISLDDFYIIHSRNHAGHMAEFHLQKSIGDNTAAVYKLQEIYDVKPKSWKVLIDPDLMRWREHSRERGRERV